MLPHEIDFPIDEKSKSADKKQPSPRTTRLWWVLSIALLAWNIYLLIPKSQAQVELAYSTFLSQVQVGNLARVRIEGDPITGSFVKPYAPPASASSTAAPATVPASQASGQTFTRFHTTFPEGFLRIHTRELRLGPDVDLSHGG